MAHTQAQIDQAIIDAVQNAIAAENSGAQAFLGAVNSMRRTIVLAITEGGPINSNTASQVKGKIKEITDAYQEKFYDILSENQRRLFVRGIQTVDAALKGADLPAAVPFLSEQVVEKAKTFGAELVTNLTDYARTRIAQQIDLAVMGQKPLEETLGEIGKNIADPSVFGTIAKRAEVVYRTEVNRMQNLGTAQRMTQIAKQIPDLKVRWLHSHVGIPRPGHMRLDGVTIGPEETFKLKGRSGQIFEIRGPHDPKLPVEEVANCKCQLVPVVGRFEKDQKAQATVTPAELKAFIAQMPKKPTTAKQAQASKVKQLKAEKAGKATPGVPVDLSAVSVPAEPAPSIVAPKKGAWQPAAPGAPLTITDKWKKVGPQMGSNPGGLYEDPSGTKWYVKEGRSDDHVRNELLANALYREAGIDVADTREATFNGKKGIASRIVDTDKLPASELAQLKGVKEGFAMDAWLANWDVVGLENDNLVKSGGKAIRLDTGASLLYRAQGEKKGAAFGSHVGEINSLRDPAKNAAAAHVFGSMTTKEIMDSMKIVMGFSEDTISKMVLAAGYKRELAEDMVNLLEKRRQDVVRQYMDLKDKLDKGKIQADRPPEFASKEKYYWSDPLPPTQSGRAPLPKSEREKIDQMGIPEKVGSRKFEEVKQSINDPNTRWLGISTKDAKDILKREKERGEPTYDHTETERGALRWYTSSGYDTMNSQLFGEDDQVPAGMRVVEELMNRSLEKMPILEQKTIYRGEHLNEFNKLFGHELKPGDTFVVKGFWSTSIDGNYGSGRPIQYVIKHKTARYVDSISSCKGEKEATTMSRVRYRILDIKDTSDESPEGQEQTIYLEEL